jgi:hypothetical protein
MSRLLAAALLFLPALAARAADDDAAKAGLEAFQAYLKDHYADKKWQTGPDRIDASAVRDAYGKQRFYCVFSAPPLPPGANIREIQEAYRRRLAEFNQTFISLTVRVDEAGKVVPLAKAEDFNAGLMKVAGDDDARTAAAAILSLWGEDMVGPGAVAPKDIKVTRSDKGWSCVVQHKTFQGTVTFNADGQCTAVSKTYTGPLPP